MNRLSAKVCAVNKANAYAMRLHKLLSPIVAQWVGQDILKADGTLRVKYEKQIPKFPEVAGIRVYKRVASYGLSFSVSGSENAEDCTMCYEASCNLAKLSNGVVGELYQCPELRTDYTAEEIEEKRKAYKKAEELAREAESALTPFGEYDR